MGRSAWDLAAGAAALVALAMVGVYLAVIRQQDGEPAPWVVAALLIGAVAAGFGAVTSSRYRTPSLLVGGAVLGGLGLLAIFSIGLPIAAAGALCLVAAARPAPQPTS